MSSLPTWRISEGNMNAETVRFILTKNQAKRKPVPKRYQKFCGKRRNSSRLFSKTVGNMASL
jgi:hypothetical protein